MTTSKKLEELKSKIVELEGIIKEKEEEAIKNEETIEDLKQRLKKYTNPSRAKKYYEANKERLIEQNKLYRKRKMEEKKNNDCTYETK